MAADSSDETGHDQIFVDERKEAGHIREYLSGSNFTTVGRKGRHSLMLNVNTNHESFLGTTPEFVGGAGHDQLTEGRLLNYAFASKIGASADLRYSLTYDWGRRNFSRSRDDLTRSNVEGYRVVNSLLSHIKAAQNLSFDVGADHGYRRSKEYTNYDVRKQVVLAQNNMADRHLTEYSVFGQGSYQQGAFSLLAGTRYTHNELFGSNVSSRGTLVYKFNPASSLKAIIGQSYRAPSFFELYFQTPTNTVYGNTNLKPETSTSFELAYLRRMGNWFGQVLAYHAIYEDKIFRTRRLPNDATDRSLAYVNGSQFEANGAEIELKYKLPRSLDLFANYTLMQGNRGDEIAGNGHYNFKYVPRHTLTVGTAKTYRDFLASGLVNYQGRTQGPKARIDAEATLDLTLGYVQRLAGVTLRHLVTAHNLTDNRVVMPEYVRRNLNEIPSGTGRRVLYTLQLEGLFSGL